MGWKKSESGFFSQDLEKYCNTSANCNQMISGESKGVMHVDITSSSCYVHCAAWLPHRKHFL